MVTQNNSWNKRSVAWWQTYPTEAEVYRRVRLAEENRLRPWGEVLFCQLRGDGESDGRLVSRLLGPRTGGADEDDCAGYYGDARLAGLRLVLRSFPPRTCAILRLYGQGIPHDAIARRYGVSRQRISQLIQGALRQARRNFFRFQNQRVRGETP